MTAELVDPVTGEVVVFDKPAARVRAQMIRDGLDDLELLVKEAYAARDWLALGYSDWDTYCQVEFRGQRLARESVASLRQSGLSQRAIASATGLSHQTVGRELATGPSGPVEPAQPVTGTNGKTYQPTRPPKPDWMKPSAERVEKKRREAQP